MLVFRIRELVAERERELGRRLPLREISEATGVSPQVLSNLGNPARRTATNTRFVEALCRYFRCDVAELMELRPPADDEATPCHADHLYPREGG